MPSVSEQIRQALSEASVPIAEIARITGVHRVNIQQFKAGTRELPLQSLEALAECLGLEIVAIPKASRGSQGK